MRPTRAGWMVNEGEFAVTNLPLSVSAFLQGGREDSERLSVAAATGGVTTGLKIKTNNSTAKETYQI